MLFLRVQIHYYILNELDGETDNHTHQSDDDHELLDMSMDEYAGGKAINHTILSEFRKKAVTLKKILQHWAVMTGCPQQHVTLLLKLVKYFEPLTDYRNLPSTCKALLWFDKTDFVTYPIHRSEEKNQLSKEIENPVIHDAQSRNIHY